ncbi:hypothetical protein PtB15_1B498 [Puccinia triticina]|nr:hypothetical protein PtB15_1B498 [Puccinia triticina]
MAKRRKRGGKRNQTADSIGEKPEYQQHWHQGDLVVQGFRRLASKYPPQPNDSPNQSVDEALSTLSLDGEAKFKQCTLDQLQSSLLPLLHRQITSLSQSLNPSGLINDPGSKLQRILEIQSELDHTINHTHSRINTVFPQSISESLRADDHHLGRLKIYRLRRLKSTFNEGFLYTLRIASLRGQELIREMRLSSEKPENEAGNEPTKDQLIEYSNCALNSINSAILSIRGSELDIAQEYWQSELIPMESVIKEMISLSNTPSNLKKAEQRPNKLKRKQVILLARLSIPMAKLCKIFFVKTTKRGMNSKGLPTSTKMSSQQIYSLTESMRNVNGDLNKFYFHIIMADNSHGVVDREEFVQLPTKLQTYLETAMRLILLHYVPNIPDMNDLQGKNYYSSWFVTWDTHF